MIKGGFKGGVTPSQKSNESGLCDMKAKFMFRPHDLHLKQSRDMKDRDYVKIKFRFKPVKLLNSDWLKSKITYNVNILLKPLCLTKLWF